MFLKRLLPACVQFHRKDAPYYAGGIAFFLLFSLAPFLLLSLSVAALLAPSSADFVDTFDTWFRSNVPRHAQALRDSLLGVFEHRGQIGLIGLVWIFVSARKLVNAIEIGLNAVLDIEKSRSGVLTTVASVAFIFVAAVLFLATVVATVMLDFVAHVEVSFVPSATRSAGMTILSAVVGSAVSIAMFYAIYRLAPAQGLTGREAIWGAVAATLLWQGARHLFVWYASRELARYEWMYGSLAGFLLLMLWAYVFALALLMGACLVKSR